MKQRPFLSPPNQQSWFAFLYIPCSTLQTAPSSNYFSLIFLIETNSHFMLLERCMIQGTTNNQILTDHTLLKVILMTL